MRPTYEQLEELFRARRRGSYARLNHELVDPGCSGSSVSMRIVEDGDGYRWTCFRCGSGGSVEHPVSALRRAAQRASGAAREDVRERDVFPGGLADLLDWPADIRQWLLSYVHTGTARRTGARYHYVTRRLWLPFHDEQQIVRWAGRGHAGAVPKYLSGRVAHYSTHDPICTVPASGERTRPAVLVEDLVSAWKLVEVAGQDGKDVAAYPLGGTVLTEAQAYSISQWAQRATVWLDNDNANVRHARRSIVHMLRGYGVQEVSSITEYGDPKRSEVLSSRGARSALWTRVLT